MKEAVINREKVSATKKIIVLQMMGPWSECLFEIENDLKITGEIFFVLIKEKTRWVVYAVSKDPTTFELRQALKKEWRGVLNVDELKKLSGIPDILFTHARGFIGAATSFESVLKMAEISLSS